jgi:hypothetical protein
MMIGYRIKPRAKNNSFSLIQCCRSGIQQQKRGGKTNISCISFFSQNFLLSSQKWVEDPVIQDLNFPRSRIKDMGSGIQSPRSGRNLSLDLVVKKQLIPNTRYRSATLVISWKAISVDK